MSPEERISRLRDEPLEMEMAEATHTSGPWSLPHFAKPDVDCMCGYVLTGDMFGAVCTVHASGEGDNWQAHGDNPKFAEAVANARLIAAAPDLLDACKQAVALFEDDESIAQVLLSAISKATQAQP